MTVLMIMVSVVVALISGVFLAFAQMIFTPGNIGSGAAEGSKKRTHAKYKAAVFCAGPKATSNIYRYIGLSDCRIVNSMYSGDRNCKDACLGYGTCRDLCPIGAIVMDSNSVPTILDDCDGCGVCAAECPSGAIQLIPRDADFIVRCSSKAEPNTRSSFCSYACTACGECCTAGEDSGFSVRDGLARIQYRARGDRQRAAKACPTGCIVPNKKALQGADNRLEWSERDSNVSDAGK